MEFYRSDKIRWPIAVIFDPIELGPGVYPEPEPDAYERFIYSQGIYAPLLDRGTRKIERRNSDARQRKARSGNRILT